MSATVSSRQQSAAPVALLTYKPSEIIFYITLSRAARRPIFLWGPPAIAKSAVAKKLATQLGIAFIDIRLSQMEPTDLRGMPYPTTENGIQYMKWSVPEVLPKDVNLIIDRENKFPVPMTVQFPSANPLADNDIHYCTHLDITVQAHDKNHVAVLVGQSLQHIEVALYRLDAKGNQTEEMVAGGFHATIKGEAHGIVAYEEFNSAAPSVINACYQLILDMRLGQYRVPKGCYQMAMGNRDGDGGQTFKMGWPIKTRFKHYEMRPDAPEWIEYAYESGHSIVVCSYIEAFPDQLYNFNKASAARTFQNYRTWSMVSDTLNTGIEIPEDLLLGEIASCISEGGAAPFIAHREIANSLPSLDAILNGDITRLPGGKPSNALAYALTATLLYELAARAERVRKLGPKWKESKERKAWLAQADTFIGFVAANFIAEIAIMAARRAISLHKLPMDTGKMPKFHAFAGANKDYIVG